MSIYCQFNCSNGQENDTERNDTSNKIQPNRKHGMLAVCCGFRYEARSGVSVNPELYSVIIMTTLKFLKCKIEMTTDQEDLNRNN